MTIKLSEKPKASNKLYKDITNKWLKSNNERSILVIHQPNDIFKYKGITYLTDNYNIVIDYKTGEVDFAKWLSKQTKKKIELFPRFNKPDGFKTADYKIGREYFDYKHTIGRSSQLIYHKNEKAQGQAVNFIVNITNDIFNEKEIENQLNYTFKRLIWVEKIGVKSKYGFKMYERIKKSAAVVKSHRDH